MPITLILASGLCINDAETMLKRKFEEWPWENYDGDSPANANVIDKNTDIDRLYKLGVRTARHLIERMILKHSDKISECLTKLPVEQALEDIELPKYKWPIAELFDIVLASKGIKLAAGTKLLYPFRPKLIPVIDSVLENYYWYSISIKDEDRFRELEKIGSWGLYVYDLMELIQQDLLSVKNEIDCILEAAESEHCSSASRLRVLESLIWYYYARGGENLKSEE